MQLTTYDRLFQIAEAQGGYFSTEQAENIGIARSQLSRYVANGKLERVQHGVYRLTPFPRVLHEDLFVAWLAVGPDAVISHDSALAVYELSDALPTQIHLTVPRTSSRRRLSYRLHTNRIAPAEITHYGGLPITTVARTLADVAFDGLADDLVIQAIKEAVIRGLASPEQIMAAAKLRGPATFRLFVRTLGEVDEQ